jgi:hypothetical protein
MNHFINDTRAIAIGMACLILTSAMAEDRNQAPPSLGDFTSQIDVGDPVLQGTAIVLSQEATLLSRNLVDFAKVPRLAVEDWTEWRSSAAARVGGTDAA